MLKHFFLILALFLLPLAAMAEDEAYQPLAYTTHTLARGPLTMALAPMPVMERVNTPETVTFTLTNASDAPLECALEYYGCDTVNVLDENGKPTERRTAKITVPARGQAEGSVPFQLGEGTLSAHYPIHVDARFSVDGKSYILSCVRVLETKVVKKGKNFARTVVKHGGVSLVEKSYSAARSYPDDTAKVELGQNWQGSDEVSRASLSRYNVSCGGESRSAFSSHPPYVPHGGSLWVDFPVTLPQADGLTLSYGSAVREVKAPEPPTDGVTFRVWAYVPGEDAQWKMLEEFHNVSTRWVDREFSLDAYSGKDVNLVLEINPGPKNNTTCDGCFISGLTINTKDGKKPAQSVDAHLRSKRFTFPLDDQTVAFIYPGSNGIFDSRIDIGNPKDEKSFLSWNGIELRVGSQNILGAGTIFTQAPEFSYDSKSNRLTCTCELLINDELQKVTVLTYAENGMLVFELPEGNPARMAGFQLKSADTPVRRVYFGHGFVLENPKESFRIGGGGHGLAASHIGMDFENGTSILMGSSASPIAMFVDANRNICTLDVNGVTKVALQPSFKGAFDAAVRYRENCSWHPEASKGVARKRGRLVFDVWGRSYPSNLEDMRKVVAYGVTDSLYIKHVWQAWGYDVTLPDIWDTTADDPAREKYGKFEDLKALAEFCAENKIPFGVHDNYIDFYPDAKDYSYRYITFDAAGNPRKAWINHGVGVQSYQWRPDLFKPFLLRNLELDRKYLPTMDAYFVDVFTSANVFDYQEADGTFHPQAETTECWKDCFRTIGAGLAHKNASGEVETAITVSEAAGDALIGGIDGADCQWMLPDPDKGGSWRMYTPCENWARTPWFAAVNHTNFSRHGAGYPERYNALRNFNLHSPMSDDYISAELLGGLDLMVDAGNVYPGAIRKHYLAQYVVRKLADKEISGVEYADGDIRRVCVLWSDGTRVYVNRGASAWKVRDVTLPKYGYAVYCVKGRLLSGIIQNPANPREVVELCQRRDGSFYMYGRGKSSVNVLPIVPALNSAEVLEGGKSFKCSVKWTCDGPAPKDLAIFVHMFEPRQGYGFTPSGWYDGGSCPIPTSKWGTDGNSVIITDSDRVYSVPDGMRDGVYHVMVGLFDAKGDGRRYPLMGEDAQEMRYSVAQFRIQGGRIVGDFAPVPCSEEVSDFFRLVANKTPFTWLGVSTLGAVDVRPKEDGSLEILPLPLLEEFDVTLDESVLGHAVRTVTRDGQNIQFTRDGKKVTFRVMAKDAKGYEVRD